MNFKFFVTAALFGTIGTSAFARDTNRIDLPGNVSVYCADARKIDMIEESLVRMQRTSETLIKNRSDSSRFKTEDLGLTSSADPMGEGMVSISIVLSGNNIGRVLEYAQSQMKSGAIQDGRSSTLISMEGCAIAR